MFNKKISHSITLFLAFILIFFQIFSVITPITAYAEYSKPFYFTIDKRDGLVDGDIVTFTICNPKSTTFSCNLIYSANLELLSAPSVTLTHSGDSAKVQFKVITTEGRMYFGIINCVADGIPYTGESIEFNTESDKTSGCYLKSLSIDGVSLNMSFIKTITYYSATVPSTISEVKINAEAEDSSDTVTIDSNLKLTAGSNAKTVTVTSKSGDKRVYTLVITKENTSACLLDSLSVEGFKLNENFNINKKDYTLTVPYSTDSLKISATAKDSSDTVEIPDATLKDGENKITIRVTSADKSAFNEYTITVTKEEAPYDTSLKSLILPEECAFDSFDSEVLEYSITVPYSVSKLPVTAVANDSSCTITYPENDSLDVGENTKTITVTSSDKKVSTKYVINVTRKQKPSDGLLKTLSIQDYDFDGDTSFDKNTFDYEITVPYDTNSIKIYAELEDERDTLKIDDNLLIDASAENAKTITVTTEDGLINTYTIKVNLAFPDSDALLSSLSVEGYNLTTPFFSKNLTYTVIVDTDEEDITINAEPEDAFSTVTINGATSDLEVGETSIKINVSSPSGANTTYTLNVIKKTSNATLSSLSIVSPLEYEFDLNKNVLQYSVLYNITEIDFAAKAEEESDKISLPSDNHLEEGVNLKYITVRSGNKFKIYTISVDRVNELDSSAVLSSLYVDGYVLNETFNSRVYTYTLTVPSNVKNVVIGATPQYEEDEVIIPTYTDLDYGINEFTVTVTSQSRERTYKIVITRPAPEGLQLKSLSVQGYDLSPEFSPETYEYYVNVPEGIFTLNVDAKIDGEGSVLVEGNTSLEPGTNNCTVTVHNTYGTLKYYIYIIKDGLKDSTANLTALNVNGYTLTPAFDPDVYDYSLTIPYSVDTLKILASANTGAMVTLPSDLNVYEGENTYQIIVEEDETVHVYNLYVTRESDLEENLCKLSKLEVTGYDFEEKFDPSTYSYTVNIVGDVNSIDITAVAKDAGDKVTIPDDLSLSNGKNSFDIHVSNDYYDRVYHITVNRTIGELSNCELISLIIDGYDFDSSFAPDAFVYTATVDTTDEQVNIIAVAKEGSKTRQINELVDLSYGENIKTIIVNNGDDKHTYTIKITRPVPEEIIDTDSASDDTSLRVEKTTVLTVITIAFVSTFLIIIIKLKKSLSTYVDSDEAFIASENEARAKRIKEKQKQAEKARKEAEKLAEQQEKEQQKKDKQKKQK